MEFAAPEGAANRSAGKSCGRLVARTTRLALLALLDEACLVITRQVLVRGLLVTRLGDRLRRVRAGALISRLAGHAVGGRITLRDVAVVAAARGSRGLGKSDGAEQHRCREG